jgi:hypothetical protein
MKIETVAQAVKLLRREADGYMSAIRSYEKMTTDLQTLRTLVLWRERADHLYTAANLIENGGLSSNFKPPTEADLS